MIVYTFQVLLTSGVDVIVSVTNLQFELLNYVDIISSLMETQQASIFPKVVTMSRSVIVARGINRPFTYRRRRRHGEALSWRRRRHGKALSWGINRHGEALSWGKTAMGTGCHWHQEPCSKLNKYIFITRNKIA